MLTHDQECIEIVLAQICNLELRQTRLGCKKLKISAWGVIVSPDESRGYLGFSKVTPPPQRFPFGRDNLKNILVRTFKFGMWVYMGNATNTIVL